MYKVDREGKMRNGEEHTDIIFARKYIDSLLIENEVDKQYMEDYINDRNDEEIIKLILYCATEMCPSLKEKIVEDIKTMQKTISEQKSKLMDLKFEQNIDVEETYAIVEQKETNPQFI